MRASRWMLGAILSGLMAAIGSAADSSKTPAEAVELFDAMKSGDIEVKIIPKDSTGGNVLITNKTKKPLSIKLPEAFAGVPVAAQFGGGQQGIGGGGNNNQQQGLGGGFGGGGGGGGFGGGGQQGGGGGFFNVPAEKVGKLPFVGVCLEHGKKDPNPNVAYELKPIEAFTGNQEVIELVKMFGRGEIDARLQRSVQAAVWNLANGLSWEELAKKVGVKHLDGRTEPYFVETQLQQAVLMTREAAKRAEGQKNVTPGKADSLSTKQASK